MAKLERQRPDSWLSGVRDGGYGAANKRQRVTSSEETVLYLECAIGYTNQHMW